MMMDSLKGMSAWRFPGTFTFPTVTFCVIEVLLPDVLIPLHLFIIFLTSRGLNFKVHRRCCLGNDCPV